MTTNIPTATGEFRYYRDTSTMDYEVPIDVTTPFQHEQTQTFLESTKNYVKENYIRLIVFFFVSSFVIFLLSFTVILFFMTPVTPNPLILISFDGFSANYLQTYWHLLGNFSILTQNGIQVNNMSTIFPSLTFVNHYSIVTGLYTESNGIVTNGMYDWSLKSYFNMSNTEPVWWNQGEPIWVTAQKQGLQSAHVYWPGSAVNIRGITPTLAAVPFNSSKSNLERLQMLFNYIDQRGNANMNKLKLFTAYFQRLDDIGHEFGPNSTEIPLQLSETNQLLGLLITGLKERGLWDRANLIIVSDHGMTGIKNIVYLNDFVPNFLSKVQISYLGGSLVHFSPLGQTDTLEIFKNLTTAEGQSVMTCYLKQNLPSRWHFKHPTRTGEIVCLAHLGNYLTGSNKGEFVLRYKGTHGYDPWENDMKSIFFAYGPSFKRGFQYKAGFENVEIYNLMAKLLKIQPSPNNGSMDLVNNLLL